jgi:glycerol uptake facilitator-like aquaporin
MAPSLLRHAVSELLGSLALVVVIGGATMMAYSNGGGLIEVATAGGLTIALFTTLFASTGAHFNPVITIATLFTRRTAPVTAGVHLVAQFAGALGGAFLLKVLYPSVVFDGTRGGGTVISVDVPAIQAWGLECLAGFVLMLAWYGAMVDKRAEKLGGLTVGFAVAMNLLMMAPLTGASMNPARSLGPAVATGIYEGLVIYFTAPLVGAVLAALLYEYVVLDRNAAAG